MQSTFWYVYPSEKSAERKRRALLANSADGALLGASAYSLHQFLKWLADAKEPFISSRLQKHLLHYLLRKTPLKYFENVKHHPSLVSIFQTAIAKLKEAMISPQKLQSLLQEAGSLKEYDLLVIYEGYENLKTELKLLDTQDLYPLAVGKTIKNIGEKIYFENFLDPSPALRGLFEKIENKEISFPAPKPLSNVYCFSMPTPNREANWLIENLIIQQENPKNCGILIGDNPLYYQPLFQKLKSLGWVSDPSPFLKWGELPQGRSLKKAAEEIDYTREPLDIWLQTLLNKIQDNPLAQELKNYLFAEKFLSLGPLTKQEWLHWLYHPLHEKPQRSTPQKLEGVQWLTFQEGDFPQLDCLLVPGLVQEQFVFQPSTPFFQDKRDRSRPDWQILTQTFEDSKKIYQKIRTQFHIFLNNARTGAWLTFPRMSSLSKELTPSNLTWEFDEIGRMETVTPPLFVTSAREKKNLLKTLEKKLEIEKERVSNNFQSDIFHANFEKQKLPSLPVQEKDFPFSPSQFETYAQCPFKYYAQRVLLVPPKKEESPEVDPQDRGTLYHQILERLFRQHKELYFNAVKNPSQEKEFYAKLLQITQEIFKEQKEQYAYSHPQLYQHLQEKCFNQLETLLSQEIEGNRKLETVLVPQYFEWRFDTKEFPHWNLDFHLKGIVDRIDWDEAGKRFLVLDYKTGRIETYPENLLKGISLQLPIYIHIIQKILLKNYEAIGGLLVSIREGKKTQGLVNKQYNKIHFALGKTAKALMEKEDLEKNIDRALEQIQEYVKKIRRGFFSPMPQDCKPTCDYKEICRFANKPKG